MCSFGIVAYCTYSLHAFFTNQNLIMQLWVKYFICFVDMSVSKVRKKKTVCNEYQLSELGKAFHINPEATLSNLQPLASRLGIKIDVARMWFYKWQVECGMEMEESERSKHDINRYVGLDRLFCSHVVLISIITTIPCGVDQYYHNNSTWKIRPLSILTRCLSLYSIVGVISMRPR